MYIRSSVFTLLSVLSIAACYDAEKDAKIRFYYSSLEHYTELPLDDADQIFLVPWYNESRPTVIFAHGFTGGPEGPAVSAVISAYLELTDSNVALLNWQHLAAAIQPNLPNSYVNWAAPNARKLGPRVASALRVLAAKGLDLNTTQLVGHSLGAHVFGIAGNQLREKNIFLPWITGLDPAGVGFEGRAAAMRLNPSSANFVSVVHTDPNKYGFSRTLGTVDFWPNYRVAGPVRQPGCERPGPMFSPEDLCSHNRCWQFLIDSLKYPGSLLGCYARNFRVWKSYSKDERNKIVLDIGEHPIKIVPGSYYFSTNAITPYGLSEGGL